VWTLAAFAVHRATRDRSAAVEETDVPVEDQVASTESLSESSP
jgi:hypothetical protein